MTNEQLAAILAHVADLLEEQAASPFRVAAWHVAARSIRSYKRPLVDVFRECGRAGLELVPHVGARLSGVLVELLKTGSCATLERLEGHPSHRLATVPGLGPRLAERIRLSLGIETLEELEMAAHDGRLDRVPGFGPRRVLGLRAVLATLLSRRHSQSSELRRPSVDQLLEIDRMYREAVAAGALRRIAPRRFNPKRLAWLPVMHGELDGWTFTAMFSNTELAHRLGRTRDWVVIYFHEDRGPEGQATVVTEPRGPRRGQRVVRGRERECADLSDAEPEAVRQAG